ncbi:MAG: exported protein of unknown function [Candidatus Saccharibacteria bacterium]|nr:exported protein of unknown function [Candidatus Saccharibacteria bacterium]
MRTKRVGLSLWFASLILMMVVMPVWLGMQTTVEAATSGPYNRDLNHGYFTGRLDYYGGQVIPGGLDAVNVGQFINEIKGFYNGSNAQRKTGAAFIINTMLEKNAPGSGRALSTSELADWEARVRSPNIVINFNEAYTFCVNSYYQDGLNDNAFFEKSGGGCWRPSDVVGGERVGNSIVFHQKNANGSAGRVLYAIRRACANPVGYYPNGIVGLPEPSFAMNSALSTSVNGASGTSAEAGDSVRFTYTAVNNGPGASDGVSCRIYTRNYPGLQATPPATPVAAGSTPGPAMACPPTFNSGGRVTTSETITATANTTHCRFFVVTPRNQAGGSISRVACVSVHTKPYFRVYGGDVIAGSNFTDPDGVCRPPARGGTNPYYSPGIISWNSGTGGGAGTQLAAFAVGAIDDFTSATGHAATPGSPIVPKGLTFANTATVPASTTYGGIWNSNNIQTCAPNYFALKSGSDPGATLNLNGGGSGSFVHARTGNLNITGGNIANGRKYTIFVDGSVTITGNIQYVGNYNSIADIPSVQIIARNIYVAPGVTRIDGTLIAQPTNATSTDGILYTCSSGTPTPTAAELNGLCRTNMLRVNGAMIARQFKFLRTGGTLRNGTNVEAIGSANLAEGIQYSPEVWLSSPALQPPASGEFNSYTALPPIL